MFDLKKEERKNLWGKLTEAFESYYDNTENLPVSPKLDQSEIKHFINSSFGYEKDPEKALDHVLEGLKKYAVHTPHPMYYGLYNPRSSFAGIMADTITAFFNPQIAAWSHAPFAAEVESFLIKSFGMMFGYDENAIDGAFTTGGAEANQTALLCAANHVFPDLKEKGWQNIGLKPVIYCSKDSHHSIQKAAAIMGLGQHSVRMIDTNDLLQLDYEKLEKQLNIDLINGLMPMVVVATMGVTGTGVIDDIIALNKLKNKYGFWLHADAAYGGAVVLNSHYKRLLHGIEYADSITFDAHKWLSIPMSAGMFFTKHPDIMSQTFGIDTGYMPKDASGLDIVDPYSHTIQWSRRFIGLKLYLSVLIYGWEGLSWIVDNQIMLGNHLKFELQKSGWKIYNQTELPVICFNKPDFESDQNKTNEICQKVVSSGNAWISVYNIKGISTLRACITNYNTTLANIELLVELLNKHSK